MKLYKFLIYAIVALTAAVLVFSLVLLVARPASPGRGGKDSDTSGTDSETSGPDKPAYDSLLAQTEDAGMEYQDSLTFFGESTTFHLVSRGVLTGGTETKQVIRPEEITITLKYFDRNTKVIHPVSGEAVSFADCISDLKPKYLILTFGINGVVGNSGSQSNIYLTQYRSLIELVRTLSPETKLILQSTFPVADVPMIYNTYNLTAEELNARIKTMNQAVKALADEYRLKYLNTFETLTDASGNLMSVYLQDTSDGIHLNKAAYELILKYIRQHSYT